MIGKGRGGGGGGGCSRGSEECHEEQVDLNWRTSIRVASRFPMDVSNSGGSSDHPPPVVAIFLFKCFLAGGYLFAWTQMRPAANQKRNEAGLHF